MTCSFAVQLREIRFTLLFEKAVSIVLHFIVIGNERVGLLITFEYL